MKKREKTKKYIVILKHYNRIEMGCDYGYIVSPETKYMDEKELIRYIKDNGEGSIEHISLNIKVSVKQIVEIKGEDK